MNKDRNRQKWAKGKVFRVMSKKLAKKGVFI